MLKNRKKLNRRVYDWFYFNIILVKKKKKYKKSLVSYSKFNLHAKSYDIKKNDSSETDPYYGTYSRVAVRFYNITIEPKLPPFNHYQRSDRYNHPIVTTIGGGKQYEIDHNDVELCYNNNNNNYYDITLIRANIVCFIIRCRQRLTVETYNKNGNKLKI